MYDQETLQAANQQAADAIGRSAAQIERANAESQERREQLRQQRAQRARETEGGGERWGGELFAGTSPTLMGQLAERQPASVWHLNQAASMIGTDNVDYARFGHHLRQVPVPWGEVLGGGQRTNLAIRRTADDYHASLA